MHGAKDTERKKLNNKIKEWNANRLDLFHLSEPNEDLEFYGVMRYFYQGDDLKYQSKCIRVFSTETTLDVLTALKSKFQSNLNKSINDKFVIYESRNHQDRKIKNSEHPLMVQLNWSIDDIEGKFILKNETRRRRSTDMINQSNLSNYGMSRSTTTLTNGFDSQTLRSQSSVAYNSSSNFFSRRFSNSKKSKRKTKADQDALQDAEDAKRFAEEMSGKPPESSFTRTISNPDDVMKRRRQKKLEFRLEQFSGVKGDGETGGTLKIYGNSINPDIPYKTLLLSVNDTAEKVLQETLDKYGIMPEDHRSYVLVQQNIPPREIRNGGNAEEIILHKHDCPLGILVNCPPKQGSAMFAVRRKRKSDKVPSSPRMPPFVFSKKSPSETEDHDNKVHENNLPKRSSLSTAPDDNSVECPRLRKLFIDADGSLYDDENGIYSLSSLVQIQPKDLLPSDGSKLIKIGSQASSIGNYPNIWLPVEEYSDIRSVHCHISARLDPQTNGMKFQLTPTLDSSSRTPRPCVIFINQQRIDSSTRICNGDLLQLGESVIFRFEEFDEETESIHSRSAVEIDQETFENSTESMNISHFTAELPITVKYKHKRSMKLVSKIMKCSKEYAEKGSKELYSCNIKSDANNLNDTFRLSPAYMLYLVMRAGLANEQQIVQLIDLIANHIDQAIHEDRNSVEKEIFWLSNTSELLHLLQYDIDLKMYSGIAQEVLAGAIEHTFTIIQQQFSKDLMILLPALLNEDDLDIDENTQEDNIPCLDRASVLIVQGSIDYPIQHLLQTLSLAFNLFHNCQVNVALTIQMFSQLFHLLNTWLFNSVLGEGSNINGNNSFSVPVCQEWGNRLTRRLNRIRYWSEINGLEMAANCHLQKMYQVSELMKADKSDLAIFGEKCIEMISLNGAQLQHLLINCQDYELPDPWIEVVVNTAIQLHDQEFTDTGDSKVSPQNKTSLALYEDMELRLPLLLPADGYCCDRGIVSCPTDLELMLNSVKDNLKYRLNPPVIDDKDDRWKAYIGTCENTPTVSRSNTIDESSTNPLKSDGPYLPRNWVGIAIPSDEMSTSDTLSSPPKDIYRKRVNITSQSSSQYSESATPRSLPSQSKQGSTYTNVSEKSQNPSIVKKGVSDLLELKLTKIDNSLGLSIIAAKASPNDMFRIYVKDVIAGGAGSKSEKIFPGDQLVSIDGNMLDDMNQDEAVVFMKKTRSEVTLLIDRGAAHRHMVMDAILQARSSKNSSTAVKPGPRPSNNQAPAIKKPLSILNTPPKVHQSKDENIRLSLPPPPTLTAKAPQKPQQTTSSNNSKLAPRKVSDLTVAVPDYNSLPTRKHQSNQSTNSEVPVYATVKKGQPLKVKFDTTCYSFQNKSSLSNSQPNLNNMITPLKRKESSSSGSCSSNTLSSTEDDYDEVSVTSKPKPIIADSQKRNSSSVYEKIPQQHQQKQSINVPPVKSVSDMNISTKKPGLPRAEITCSDSELRSEGPKKQFLSRPVLTQNSDPVVSMSSQDDSEPISLNKPVTRHESSSSESESETISTCTVSSSSFDSSPQPQRKLNCEQVPVPIQINPVKPQTITLQVTSDELLADRKPPTSISNLGGFKKPLRITNAKSDDRLTSLPNEESLNSSKGLREGLDQIVNVKNKNPINETIETKTDLLISPSEDEIKLRRKAIADAIRHETEERERRSQVAEIQPNIPPADNKDNKRNSTKYGRPQFNATNQVPRPVSLFEPESTNVSDRNETVFNFPSPPSSLIPNGIVVPASPINKSKVIGSNETFKNPYSYTPMTNHLQGFDKCQDGVEELSFREKMKLFAARIGDDTVIERKKIGRKQQKINSGDYS